MQDSVGADVEEAVGLAGLVAVAQGQTACLLAGASDPWANDSSNCHARTARQMNPPLTIRLNVSIFAAQLVIVQM